MDAVRVTRSATRPPQTVAAHARIVRRPSMLRAVRGGVFQTQSRRIQRLWHSGTVRVEWAWSTARQVPLEHATATLLRRASRAVASRGRRARVTTHFGARAAVTNILRAYARCDSLLLLPASTDIRTRQCDYDSEPLQACASNPPAHARIMTQWHCRAARRARRPIAFASSRRCACICIGTNPPAPWSTPQGSANRRTRASTRRRLWRGVRAARAPPRPSPRRAGRDRRDTEVSI